MRSQPARFTAALLLLCALGACASPCEVRRGWHAEPSAACQTCEQTDCAAALAALAGAPFDCGPGFACAGRCPNRSDETCGCEETCLTRPECRAPFDAYTRCVVEKCDAVCH